jgi:MFS family permease
MASALFGRHESLRALRHRDFQLLLAGSTIVGFTMPVQFLTQIFWIEDNYASREVLYVGLLAASRGFALLAFSLLGGAIADRFERRRVLLGCESTALTLNAIIAVLMIMNPFGEATVAALLVVTFLAAGNMAIDMPTRTASIPAIVGMDDLANGISLQMIGQQLAAPLALPLAGVLNGLFDAGHVYAGSLAAWLLILPLISSLRYHSVGEANRQQSVLGNVRAGLSYSWREPTIFAVVLMVLILYVVGMPGPSTLGPVWMTTVLGLSKAQFGAIAMTWGLGAMVGSFVFARQHALARRGVTLCAMTLTFAVSAIIFGHSRLIPLTAIVNFTLGFSLVGTMVSASTIVQYAVSDEMRGRVMGLFPLAMGLAMLNGAPVSAVGQVAGLELVLPILAWTMLALTLGVIVSRPNLRRLEVGAEAVPAPAAT